MRLRNQRHNLTIGGIFAVCFALAGGILLLLTSHAATSTASVEAENGTLSVASTVNDSTASGGAAVKFSAATGSNGLPTSYTVQGNVIRDSTGAIFTPHGVDRDTTEWSCTGTAIDGSNGIPASDFTTMHNVWKANIVRIALTQDLWLSNAAKYCSSYQTNITNEINNAHQAGMRVILDLHWSDMGNLGNTNPAQQCMADQNSIPFWQQVATAYKNDPNVWFELYNEPQGISWNVWQNGGSTCGFTAVGMQQLYNTVRATGANNIVVAGGINYASHLDGVPLLTGTNIAYAIHPYANDISGGDPNAWSTSDWDNRFGNLATQVPVIATEFGSTSCGTNSYDQAILDYFRTHGIGYTAWAWINGGCSYPSLISDAAGDCVNGGCSIEADLQKFASGQLQMTYPGIGTVPAPLNP